MLGFVEGGASEIPVALGFVIIGAGIFRYRWTLGQVHRLWMNLGRGRLAFDGERARPYALFIGGFGMLLAGVSGVWTLRLIIQLI